MIFRCIYVVIYSALFGHLNGIDIRKCPRLPAPENGHVICDHLLGAFCAPVCQPGFDFETTPASAYVCNPMSKSWATYPAGYPLPWPNCVNATSSVATMRSSVPIKKSQVNQMRSRALQLGIASKNESLWQRMLRLTSELTKNKVKGLSKGAARSDLSNDTPSNYNAYPTASTSSYQAANEIPQAQSTNQETEFQKLQEYWNEYYRNYYKSLNVKVDDNNNPPDWTLRSPWSNDPEHVEGALDKDFAGRDSQANSTTIYQNWNSYLQSFYQYPTPSNYKFPNSTQSYYLPMPNSSSDHFIDSVISNDLQSRKVPDATVNRDLYYEDRLIQMEESKRPYLNVSYYMPTTTTTATSTTTPKETTTTTTTTMTATTKKSDSTQSSRHDLLAANQSLDYVTTSQNNMALPQSGVTTTFNSASGVPAPYDIAFGASTTNSNANPQPQPNNDTRTGYKSQTTPRSKQQNSVNSVQFSESNTSAGGNSSPDRGSRNHDTDMNMKTNGAKNTNYGSQYGANRLNSTLVDSSENESNVPPISSTFKTMKNNNNGDTKNLGAPKTDSGTPVESYTTQTTTDDDSDDTDYLDDLDITALVRELIKLESIRKQKQMRRRKKMERENMKLVGNMFVGDVFKGYFKNKKLRSQKGLKKQLLNKAKMLIKAKAKGPPLPKFS